MLSYLLFTASATWLYPITTTQSSSGLFVRPQARSSMAAPFSWSDTINIAFGSCLPCLKPALRTGDDQADNTPHNPAINRILRARADELQGLLADPDTDIEAETLSLHSNPGRARQGKKKRRGRTKNAGGAPRRITLFGYDLYGRPPIQLPENDDDALYDNRNGAVTPTTTMTFDSDAAPLDAEAIAAMSTPGAMASAATQAADAEAQRLREKEERRQRRKEKREMRRLAEALAQGNGEETFEGFQGSGGGSSDYPRIPDSMFPRGPTSDSGSGSASGFSGSGSGGFGRFVEAPAQQAAPQAAEDDDVDAAADLDGAMYARRVPRGAPGAGGSNGSGSRSRGSASQYAPSPLHAQFQAHPADPSTAQPKAYKKAKSKSSSSRTSRSHSSATASPSLPSPVSPAFAQEAQVVSPSTVEHGQGFFDLEDDVDSTPVRRSRKGSSAYAAQFSKSEIVQEETTSAFPATRIGGSGGFPSTGFGGGASRARDFGVFLSRRGDEEEAGDSL